MDCRGQCEWSSLHQECGVRKCSDLDPDLCAQDWMSHCKWRYWSDVETKFRKLEQMIAGNGSADLEKRIHILEQTVAGNGSADLEKRGDASMGKRIQNLERLVPRSGNAAVPFTPQSRQCKTSVAISQELAEKLKAVKCND